MSSILNRSMQHHGHSRFGYGAVGMREVSMSMHRSRALTLFGVVAALLAGCVASPPAPPDLAVR